MTSLPGGPSGWLQNADVRRFITFLLVGGLNTVVGYAIFAALILLGLSTPAAVVLGTTLSVVFNFYSTGGLVFRNRSGNLLPRFVGVYVVQMGLGVVLLTALERAGLHPLVGALVAMPLLAVFTYLAMRRFVYS